MSKDLITKLEKTSTIRIFRIVQKGRCQLVLKPQINADFLYVVGDL